MDEESEHVGYRVDEIMHQFFQAKERQLLVLAGDKHQGLPTRVALLLGVQLICKNELNSVN